MNVLRMAISNIRNKAIELGHDLEESEIISVLKSDAKKIKDSLDSFVAAARADLAEAAKGELAILERYLPAQMSDEDLKAKVVAKIAELNVQTKAETGKVVGALAKELSGQADGSRIKAIVESILKD